MKILPTLTMTAALAATSLAYAQDWQLIDNFDDGDLAPWAITESTYNVIGVEPGYEDGDVAYMELRYPDGYETNPGMHIESGGYGVADQFGSTWAIAPLPITPADGTTCTVYFQYYQEGGSNAFHIGMTTLEAIIRPEEDRNYPITKLYEQPAGWGHYSFLYAMKENSLFRIRDGGRYVNNPDFQLQNYTWYEIWLVAHNRDGAFQAADGDTFEIWVRGGEWDSPTQVLVPPPQEFDGNGDPNPYQDFAAWRNPAADPLRYVMVASETGPPDAPNDGDPHIIDDLYITEGEFVETPAGATLRSDPESYHGYPVVTYANNEKWVDTEDLMGWIMLAPGETDPDWVYSADLASWVYTSWAEDGGLWLYVVAQ